MRVAALAGRRLSGVDGAFPPERVAAVRERIEAALVREGIELLVCSAADGADLVALEIAMRLGIARQVVKPSLERGELVTLLPDYPVPEFWVKALIPKNRIDRPAVGHLLTVLKQGFADTSIANGLAAA